MSITEISIIALIVLAITLGRRGGRKAKSGAEETTTAAAECSSCTGHDGKCEQECMMEAAVKPVEHYDDEELDSFAGRSSDSYEPHEVEQFAYVLHTMRQDEVAGWCRSLTLRAIALPDELKDEAIMMIDDGHT